MNLKDILELEEIKNTLIANALRWWITGHLGRTIDTVMWWNVKEHPPIIGGTEHIELSACFKDGTPFVQMFKKEELREKARAVQREETKRSISSRDIIHEAYDIAEAFDATIIELVDGWRICLENGYRSTVKLENDYHITAKDAKELLERVKTAKTYWEASQDPCPPVTGPIHESYRVAGSVDTMCLTERKIPGYPSLPAWMVSFTDLDYTAQAVGAEQLLATVNAAKAYYETLQSLAQSRRKR